jgi:hypothetical protein
MDDAAVVRGLERIADLLCEREDFVEWNRPACDSIRKCFAFDQF